MKEMKIMINFSEILRISSLKARLTSQLQLTIIRMLRSITPKPNML